MAVNCLNRMVWNVIYADNAATTQLSKAAFDAMIPWLVDEYGNASQPYSFARKPKTALSEAREIIAGCINANQDEIFFTSGGTEGDNWAIKGSAFADSDKKATITSAIEHHAVLRSCAAIERLGYPVAYLSPNNDCVITAEVLRRVISDKTRLVSIMFANNEIGTVQPVKDLCAVSHSHNAIFHTDAVQAVGHIPIDVKSLGVDMLSASAHKFNGPKGIGFVYIRSGVRITPYADGGAQEKMHRAGTENIAAIVGMATALKQNCEKINENATYVGNLETALLNRLIGHDIHFHINGGNHRLPGLLSLSFDGVSGESLLHCLDLMGICVSTGSACDGNSSSVSHVLHAINLDEKLAQGTIRVSLGKNNTFEEMDTLANSLRKALLLAGR